VRSKLECESTGSTTEPAGIAEGLVVCGSSQFKNNYFTEMCSGSEEGSYLRLIDVCITQL